jgi:hypothetical protein
MSSRIWNKVVGTLIWCKGVLVKGVGQGLVLSNGVIAPDCSQNDLFKQICPLTKLLSRLVAGVTEQLHDFSKG